MKGTRLKINPHSLQWKFFAITLCIALCVMALSLSLCYVIAVRTIENMTAGVMNEYIQYADQNVSDMMSNAMAVSLAISMDREVVASAISDTSAEASYTWYLRAKSLENHLSGVIADKAYISRAFVAVSDGRIYQSSGPLMRRAEIGEAWFQDAVGQQSLQIRYSMGGIPYITISRPVSGSRGLDAVVMLELDYDALVHAYDMEPLQSASLLVYTPQGDLFFAGGQAQIETEYAQLEYWPTIESGALSTRYQTLGGTRCFVVQYRSGVTGLSTVGIITEKALILDAMHMSSQIAGITVVSVLLAAAAAIAFSFVLYRNLSRLMKTMKAVRNGGLNVRSDIRSRDEIGELSSTFNSMMERIEGLMEAVKMEEAKKREAEQNVLAAQIQPHFIYNAISAIQYIAHMRDEAEIEQAASALSHLLRSVLGNRDAFITLWEEREYIGSYMALQRFKYQREFALCWDVQEDLWTLPIPKLLIQPIVENALIHGIALKENGVITVKVLSLGDEVIIKVIDDGKGMQPGQIEQITSGIAGEALSVDDVPGHTPNREGIGEAPRTFRNFGMHNVFTRLQLIYGPGASYRITSEPGIFTCVELRFPRKKEDFA